MAASLLAFVVVYFIVFGAGVCYILQLMSQPPHRGEAGPRARPAGARRRHHAAPAVAGSTRDRQGGLIMLAFDLPIDLGLHHRLRDLRLCRDGRLRPRHRHPVPAAPGRPRARQAMNSHRAGVGRQRDLAGAGRRRPAGGLSAGLCDDPVGALCADHRHAAGAGLPRRRLRVPLARSAPSRLLGRRLQRRLGRRGARAGHHAGRAAAGHRGRETAPMPAAGSTG